jgi:hypothetical protein
VRGVHVLHRDDAADAEEAVRHALSQFGYGREPHRVPDPGLDSGVRSSVPDFGRYSSRPINARPRNGT